MNKPTFYITTPIYYPSDRLHIGHAYTTVAADAIARWHRFAGHEVFFLTGSDEHGQKVERAARERGQEPGLYVDRVVATFQELWQRLGISYDRFIRTTETGHAVVAQQVFQALYEKGDIYKGAYAGWYCTHDETFWVESKLIDGKCPDCGRPVEFVREESYFFRLSKYAGRLLAHIEAHPEFILPPSRRNEMVNFIKGGLEDLSVSRTTFRWGIPVPFDERHVIYVWIDALSNYLTGIGYLTDQASFGRFWPADVHLVGKDILRFHTIIWPMILMALDLPLPKKVFGHGWLLSDSNDKMSKSKGNVVDPNRLIDEFGADAIRYFLLREISFGQDAHFSRQALIDRINADLANDLGNVVHRSLAMLERYFAGRVPEPGAPEGTDHELRAVAEGVVREVARRIAALELNEALADIWRLVNRLNKYIDETEPWSLARHESRRERLATVMYQVVEGLRLVSLLVGPFLPTTATKIWDSLGIGEPFDAQRLEVARWGRLKPGVQTRRGEPLFPRIESGPPEENPAPAPKAPAAAEGLQAGPASQAAAPKAADAPRLSIGDFERVELRVARVLSAERMAGANKLLKLQLDLGGEERQVIAGLARHYAPEALVGKSVVVVANLQPARLRGELSEGMILAAVADAGDLKVITVDGEIPPGSRVQ